MNYPAERTAAGTETDCDDTPSGNVAYVKPWTPAVRAA